MHKKNLKFFVIVIVVIAILASVTYAWYVYRVAGISGDTYDCFNIDYVSGNDLSGEIPIAYDYTSGVYTEMKAKINSACSRVYGTADIVLNSTSFKTTDNVDLFTSAALKYVVLVNGTYFTEGNVIKSGENVIATNLDVARYNESEITYRVYFYLDAELINNSDVDSSYDGSIFMRFKMLGDESLD